MRKSIKYRHHLRARSKQVYQTDGVDVHEMSK